MQKIRGYKPARYVAKANRFVKSLTGKASDLALADRKSNLGIDQRTQMIDDSRMLPFSTEFPVRPSENRAAFVAEIIAWLRGMDHQTVLSSKSETELDGANVHIRSDTGETLRMRELQENNSWSAVGARHDLPDNQGRIWRTECVLKRFAAEDGQDLIRLRTQCIATAPGTKIETPRKPYLIKTLLKENWGGTDRQLQISDQPVWLKNTGDGLSIASDITFGDATKWLPVLYVSATGNSSWLFNIHKIEKLAYDLGGIAHVVVEPNRTFSFKLRDKTEARNAYGGTLGLSVPGQGIVRQYDLGWENQDGNELISAIKAAILALRSQMPASGWDWADLQEQALRDQRERERAQLTAEEIEKLYQGEIDNLQDKIRQQKQQIEAASTESAGTFEGEFSTINLVRLLGPEIYPGEISDRLRLAAKLALSDAERLGLDQRSKAILQRTVKRFPAAPALAELSQDLQRATKNPKRMAKELISLLNRHGYHEKADNKHIRLVAKNDYEGLEPITIAKTPSENRGLKNIQKQIERTLGLTKLMDRKE